MSQNKSTFNLTQNVSAFVGALIQRYYLLFMPLPIFFVINKISGGAPIIGSSLSAESILHRWPGFAGQYETISVSLGTVEANNYALYLFALLFLFLLSIFHSVFYFVRRGRA